MSKSIRASIFVLVALAIHMPASMANIYPADIGTYLSIVIMFISLLNACLTIGSARWRKTPSANE